MTWPTLRERFDVVFFIGVLYHLRHPLLALDLIHEHVAKDLLIFQSMQRGSSDASALAPDYEFWESGIFDDPGYPKLHFIEQQLRARPDQLVGAEPRLLGGDAAKRGLRHREPSGGGSVHLPPCRARAGRRLWRRLSRAGLRSEP